MCAGMSVGLCMYAVFVCVLGLPRLAVLVYNMKYLFVYCVVLIRLPSG